MSNSERMAFSEGNFSTREEDWGGAENKVSSIAFDVPESTPTDKIEYTHVLKEPQEKNYFEVLAETHPPSTEEEKEAFDCLIAYFDSKDHFLNSEQDFELMSKVFGDIVPETDFIIHVPRNGNKEGLFIVQEKINGKTWTDFSKGKTSEENQEFMMQHRGQLVRLIGGDRKILIETGGPADIWGKNLMVDENDNFKLIDPGPPSELERQFTTLLQLPKDLRAVFANNMLSRVSDLDRYTSVLQMTQEEISKMNEGFGITEEQYTAAKEKLIQRCKELLG